jgi:hypothetical protein
MKKYILVLVVFVLVLSSVVIAGTHPTWASMLPASKQPAGVSESASVKFSPTIPAQPATGDNSIGAYVPPAYHTEISGIGAHNNNNIGGVCLYDVNFKVNGMRVVADAEVPIPESKIVPFSGDGELLFPGCRFVYYKNDVKVNPLATADGTAKVCFGANPNYLEMTIYYYLQDPLGGTGNRVWEPLPTEFYDNGRLVCVSAQYNGVYMPVGKLVLPDELQPGQNPLFPNGAGSSILPPPPSITITGSGTYAVGGICLIKIIYKVPGLSDIVEVEYPTKHYTEDTLTVNSAGVDGLFYWPGCHVVHYKDQVVKDQMTSPEGDWQLCFAAIPGKTMTIYYYRDDLTTIAPPWTALPTTTADGMACADPVDFSAVYVPVAK